jgi:holin-like protein
MIDSLARVLALLIAAEAAAVLMAAPVPGAALGLIALALIFAVTGGPDPDIARLFDMVAPHAPLLFVPAAVGVVANLDTLVLFWAAFAAAIIFGTSAVLVVTALSAQALLRPVEERPA